MTTFARSASGATVYSRSTIDSPFQPQVESSGYTQRFHDATMQLWDRVIDELLRIRNLEDDYDGEGTEAPAPALVDGAIRLAKSFREERSTPPDRVHAGVNATVYFEWFTSVGYGELEIVSPVQAEGRFLKTGSSMPEIYNVTI